ncbi:glycosyltransferase [Massilia sp. PWRC2]|uniref:glycosyltransferase n=1 Tax=Massilia sp. PWRC2 TaxID=2804626 RepID=UPI003CFB8F00
MKSKKLMMVSTGFPYGQGESFIEAELAYVSDFFAKVTLVPSFSAPHTSPRATPHDVELAYAKARWGAARVIHVISSFIRALGRQPWLGEAMTILGRAHRIENLKELARSLYRARLFEQFLERQFAAGKHYDMIYFYWMVPEIAGALSFRNRSSLESIKTITIVARGHGGDLYEELRPGGYAGLIDTITAGIDAVFCISEHGKKYLTDKYPELKPNFHLARLGVVDPGFINPQPQDDILSILSCSFMVPGKRIHLIIQAIEFLLKVHPHMHVRWTHIGDGELFDQLHLQASRLLSSHNVEVVLKGYMPQAAVVAYYRDAAFDVIVNVSDSEGIPVSLMEASSVGIPMVATDVGGSSEIVNAANGILIEASASPARIAAALLTFTNKSLARSYRIRARSDWSTSFNAQCNYLNFGRALLRSMERS